ncbi:unnamed protein product [Allacma fusca]|uniref:Uncharacterized protein n=1 Tax=Allacma fusca TaxID=39272 RepID=A0A8J2NL65_9HEXA|nr:unnamed protein product [Allacma fusca]
MVFDTVLDYEALSFNEIGAYEELPPIANFTLSIHNVWTSKGHFLPGRFLANPVIINYNEHFSMNPDCLNLKGLSPNRHVLVYVERSCVRLFVGKYCQGAYATFTNPRVIKPYNFPWRSVGPCKYIHFI